jgi:hypothetical protein
VPPDAHGLPERRDRDERRERIPARRKAPHCRVIHRDPAVGVASLDVCEVAAKYLLAVVAAEVELSDPRSTLREVPELLQVLDVVCDGDEDPAGPNHTRELRQSAVEVLDVVEHPRGDSYVELAVGEREGAYIADTRIDSLRALSLDHRLGLVDADELRADLVGDALCELALAAANLEYAPRLRRGDRLQRELSRIIALGVDVRGLAGPEIVGRRVLLADERRVVRPAQRRAAFGSISSSEAISSRIFSSERRISRDTCICEMPTCCAICDCVRPSKKRR